MIATGIHICEHDKNGKLLSKLNYNYRQGMQVIKINRLYGAIPCAVGFNGFALAVHYRRKY